MKAIIIAAGMGIRLKSISGEIPKPMTPVLKESLLERIVKVCGEARVKDFGIVTGYQHQVLQDWLGDGSQWGVSFEYVYNPDWKKNNGISAYCAHRLLDSEDEPFLLMMSDHLFNRELIRGIIADESPKNLLAVDRNLEQIFDMDDATKVYCEGRRIVHIGKMLSDYNAVDCGMFRLKRNFFPAMKEAIDRGDDQLSHGIRVLIEQGDFEAHFISEKSHWLDVDTEEAHRFAETHIEFYTY